MKKKRAGLSYKVKKGALIGLKCLGAVRCENGNGNTYTSLALVM